MARTTKRRSGASGRKAGTRAQAAHESLPYRPCVGIMLMNDDGGVFVGQRIDMSVEAWQMPQGGIDNDETPEQAAWRELAEETGTNKAEIVAECPEWLTYDLPAEVVGKVWGGKYRGQAQKWFLMRFTGTDDDIDLETEHPEFADWRWIPVSELLTHIVAFKRPVYQKVIETFQRIAADRMP